MTGARKRRWDRAWCFCRTKRSPVGLECENKKGRGEWTSVTSCPAYVITETAVHIFIKSRKSLKDFIQGRKWLDINSILGWEGRWNPPNTGLRGQEGRCATGYRKHCAQRTEKAANQTIKDIHLLNKWRKKWIGKSHKGVEIFWEAGIMWSRGKWWLLEF